ncbi:hypothetical protein [Actinoplanes sp. NPDC049681]|uniref:hypothetical protein n=1 Tax=Actinoplanes sp. NPDC049681 TaxID=3363905 RepID=UPI00379A33EC
MLITSSAASHFGFTERMSADGFASLGPDDGAVGIVFPRRGWKSFPGSCVPRASRSPCGRARSPGESGCPWSGPDGIVDELVEWVTPRASRRLGR